MACRGVHFALTDQQVQKLVSLASDGERLVYVQEEIEEELLGGSTDWAYETDKAWDAIHRSLTDGTLSYASAIYPLSHVILGGTSVYAKRNYIMSLKSPQEVRDVSSAIEKVSRDLLAAGYRQIRERSYAMTPTDEDFEYTWAYFDDMRPFWERAAAAGRHVLFTVDQ